MDDDQLLIVGKAAEKIVGCGCVDYEMLVPEFCYITGKLLSISTVMILSCGTDRSGQTV